MQPRWTTTVDGLDRGRRPSKKAAGAAVLQASRQQNADAGERFGPLPPGAPDIWAVPVTPQGGGPSAAPSRKPSAPGNDSGSTGGASLRKLRGAENLHGGAHGTQSQQQGGASQQRTKAGDSGAASVSGRRPAWSSGGGSQRLTSAGGHAAKPSGRAAYGTSADQTSLSSGGARASVARSSGGGGASSAAAAAAAAAAASVARHERLQRLKERRLANSRLPALAAADEPSSDNIAAWASGGGAPLTSNASPVLPAAMPQHAPTHISMAERVRHFREAPPLPRELRAVWSAGPDTSCDVAHPGAPHGMHAAAPVEGQQWWEAGAAPVDWDDAAVAWTAGRDCMDPVSSQGDAAPWQQALPPLASPQQHAPAEGAHDESEMDESIPAGLTPAQYDELTEKLLERCRRLLGGGAPGLAQQQQPALPPQAPAIAGVSSSAAVAAALASARAALTGAAARASAAVPSSGGVAARSPLMSPVELRLQRLLHHPSPGTTRVLPATAGDSSSSISAAAAARRAALLASPQPRLLPAASAAGEPISWRERLRDLLRRCDQDAGPARSGEELLQSWRAEWRAKQAALRRATAASMAGITEPAPRASPLVPAALMQAGLGFSDGARDAAAMAGAASDHLLEQWRQQWRERQRMAGDEAAVAAEGPAGGASTLEDSGEVAETPPAGVPKDFQEGPDAQGQQGVGSISGTNVTALQMGDGEVSLALQPLGDGSMHGASVEPRADVATVEPEPAPTDTAPEPHSSGAKEASSAHSSRARRRLDLSGAAVSTSSCGSTGSSSAAASPPEVSAVCSALEATQSPSLAAAVVSPQASACAVQAPAVTSPAVAPIPEAVSPAADACAAASPAAGAPAATTTSSPLPGSQLSPVMARTSAAAAAAAPVASPGSPAADRILRELSALGSPTAAAAVGSPPRGMASLMRAVLGSNAPASPDRQAGSSGNNGAPGSDSPVVPRGGQAATAAAAGDGGHTASPLRPRQPAESPARTAAAEVPPAASPPAATLSTPLHEASRSPVLFRRDQQPQQKAAAAALAAEAAAAVAARLKEATSPNRVWLRPVAPAADSAPPQKPVLNFGRVPAACALEGSEQAQEATSTGEPVGQSPSARVKQLADRFAQLSRPPPPSSPRGAPRRPSPARSGSGSGGSSPGWDVASRHVGDGEAFAAAAVATTPEHRVTVSLLGDLDEPFTGGTVGTTTPARAAAVGTLLAEEVVSVLFADTPAPAGCSLLPPGVQSPLPTAASGDVPDGPQPTASSGVAGDSPGASDAASTVLMSEAGAVSGQTEDAALTDSAATTEPIECPTTADSHRDCAASVGPRATSDHSSPSPAPNATLTQLTASPSTAQQHEQEQQECVQAEGDLLEPAAALRAAAAQLRAGGEEDLAAALEAEAADAPDGGPQLAALRARLAECVALHLRARGESSDLAEALEAEAAALGAEAEAADAEEDGTEGPSGGDDEPGVLGAASGAAGGHSPGVAELRMRLKDTVARMARRTATSPPPLPLP